MNQGAFMHSLHDCGEGTPHLCLSGRIHAQLNGSSVLGGTSYGKTVPSMWYSKELLPRAQGNLNNMVTVLVYFIGTVRRTLKWGFSKARESQTLPH